MSFSKNVPMYFLNNWAQLEVILSCFGDFTAFCRFQNDLKPPDMGPKSAQKPPKWRFSKNDTRSFPINLGSIRGHFDHLCWFYSPFRSWNALKSPQISGPDVHKNVQMMCERSEQLGGSERRMRELPEASGPSAARVASAHPQGRIPMFYHPEG